MSDSVLNIFIVTYNRAPLLRRTLGYLAASCLRDFPITVLNNASTDDTAAVANEASAGLSDFKLITHHANVGANANILRAFDHSRARYTWILCDDDIVDLSHFADVLRVLEVGEVDLIHVGAHKQDTWNLGGVTDSPRNLLAQGYAYFKFSSFTPCNIFKTQTFVKNYLIKGYNNIGNSYPHMPFAFGTYLQDKLIYISKKQLVEAQGGQSYSPKDWYLWWMKTCELLKIHSEVRNAYLNQWQDNGYVSDKKGLQSLLVARKLTKANLDEIEYVNIFIERYFSVKDRLKLIYYTFNVSMSRYYVFNMLSNAYNKIKMSNNAG